MDMERYRWKEPIPCQGLPSTRDVELLDGVEARLSTTDVGASGGRPRYHFETDVAFDGVAVARVQLVYRDPAMARDGVSLAGTGGAWSAATMHLTDAHHLLPVMASVVTLIGRPEANVRCVDSIVRWHVYEESGIENEVVNADVARAKAAGFLHYVPFRSEAGILMPARPSVTARNLLGAVRTRSALSLKWPSRRTVARWQDLAATQFTEHDWHRTGNAWALQWLDLVAGVGGVSYQDMETWALRTIGVSRNRRAQRTVLDSWSRVVPPPAVSLLPQVVALLSARMPEGIPPLLSVATPAQAAEILTELLRRKPVQLSRMVSAAPTAAFPLLARHATVALLRSSDRAVRERVMCALASAA